MGLQDKVEFLGWQKQEKVVALLKTAHILLAPSVTASDGDQEGIPVIIMEAMAIGVPVVSTYHSGIPELVVDGKSGFLAKERDSEGLAVKMKAIIEDGQSAKAMVEEARKTVSDNFNKSILNISLRKTFKEIIQPAK